MLGRKALVVAAALLLAISCGGDGGSSPPVADPNSPATTPPTSEVEPPQPTVDVPLTTETPGSTPVPTTRTEPTAPSTTHPQVDTTAPGPGMTLEQILGRREAWVISNSDFTAYSIEPCWTRDPDDAPPYGIFQSDPVDRATPVETGDIFICSILTEPVSEPGNLLIAVLTDDGRVATQQSSSGEESLPFTVPQGLGCGEFIDLPDIAAWTNDDSYSDWGPGAAYRLVVAYWFVENQAARMDPDGDGVPCEEVVAPEVIAAAWSGDF